MDTSTGLLAIVPAVFDNPNTNEKWMRMYCGQPLIAHTIQLAKSCSEIVRIAVVTNSAKLTKHLEGEQKLFKMTAEKNEPASSWISRIEKKEGEEYRLVLRLNPFFPFRTPENIMECFQRMIIDGLADGVEAVVRTTENKGALYCEEEGYLVPKQKESRAPFFRKTDAYSIFRRETLSANARMSDQRVIPYEIPDYAGISLENPEHDRLITSLIKDPCSHII